MGRRGLARRAATARASGITMAVTTILTVVTYHFLVRSTAIGVLLNGKRYPRTLPSYDALGNYLKPQVSETSLRE